jgi:hypothetical protein
MAGLVLGAILVVGCNTILNPRPDGDVDFASIPGEAEVIADVKASDTPTMHSLACDLDHLEWHIDWFGSVTAKVPDIWGQARLTTYREEFEKQMAAEEGNFQFALNGSISRSDQAFFASATALSFAVQPQPPVIGRVTTTKSAPPTLVPTQQTVQQEVTDAKTGTKTVTNTTLAPAPTPSPPPAPTPIQPLPVDDPSKLIAAGSDAFTRSAVTLSRPPIVSQTAAITIEPAEYLAQKKRYLDFLNQLRRENEGDDTADSPGYSLNLMRVPVSVLPGKRTDIGFGAEITMTATPILGDDLLEMTFRNLLTNDLNNQLGFPLTQVLDPRGMGLRSLLDPKIERFLQILELLSSYLADPDRAWGHARLKKFINYLNSPEGQQDREALKIFPRIKDYLVKLGITLDGRPPTAESDTATTGSGDRFANMDAIGSPKLRTWINQGDLTGGAPPPPLELPFVSFSNGLDNRTAFPTSQLLLVDGIWECFKISFSASGAFKSLIEQQGYAHLPDIQGYLKEETRAAYMFLRANPQLWIHYCTPDLVQAIRTQRWDTVDAMRRAYRKEVAFLTNSEPVDPTIEFKSVQEPIHMSKTTALGWCLIVDGALLTDRLIRDMRETASAKGLALAGCDHWCPYFLPDPPPECRQAFNEYVRIRWPIRIFALDPYIQEQNIADSLSTRREIQLALSIAFTNGQINARQLTRFARRLEAEYETIDLNRTQVGFGHGENVFGWRFYPRYQTPDTDSNLTVFVRDMLIGGPTRNQLLRQRRLEPGMRECVAIVMMPSFVPYLTLDTVSNWFPITNPKHKVLDIAQAMRLSRTVTTIKNERSGVVDAEHYRPGDFERLLRRADQLEARLPTQTLVSPVPILNTYGGFEMFANGTTDLAPELFGWYGAPGIDPTADTTTLFLVGDHFSPLRTKVLVGNEQVQPAYQTMLSRQVMQVSFNKPQYALAGPNGKEIRIHLATPYGVTRELSVPWIKQIPSDPPPGFTFGDAKLTALYGFGHVPSAKGNPDPDLFVPVPAGAAAPPATAGAASDDAAGGGPSLKINWVAPGGTIAQNVAVAFQFDYPPGTITLPCQGGYKATVKGKTVTIATPELNQMARDLIAEIAKLSPTMSRAANPLANPIKSKKVTITANVTDKSGVVAQAALTLDQLSVVFQPWNGCPTNTSTAQWMPNNTVNVPFTFTDPDPKKRSGITKPPKDADPTPPQVDIQTESTDLQKLGVDNVALTLTLKASDSQTNTIKLPLTKKDGTLTIDKGKISFPSTELSKALLAMFKDCLPADVTTLSTMTVTAATIDLKSGDQSVIPSPLTVTNTLIIKWDKK